MRRRLTDAGQRARDLARRHAFWLALPVATLGVVIVAGVVGRSALLRADAWEVRLRELAATRAAAAMWRAELVPPDPEERAAWDASRAAVRERGIDRDDRLGLLQEVAQRAEDLGITGARVAFIPSDTLNSSAVREVGEAIFAVAPWALSVRFAAEYGAVASFVGSLPPQVDVHRLRLMAGATALEAELVLIVFARDGA